MADETPVEDAKLLAIKKSVADLSSMYAEDVRQQSFNALICGETGAGKTYLCHTARFPCHIDSFDPGGTQGLRDKIVNRDIIVDSRYENEDPLNPKAYREWKNTFLQRVRDGYFNHFGTYVLDSSSMWSVAIMNWILAADRRPGTAPKWEKDYGPQKVEIKNMIAIMTSLPCDFLLMGHLKPDKDEVTGKTTYRFMSVGDSSVTIPMAFSEIYVMMSESKGAMVERKLLTQKDSFYMARTRLGAGKFERFEEPNIKAMLKKAGFPHEDKPNIFR